MQRYFFHIVSKEDLLFDHEGYELQSLFCAHAHAVQLIFKSCSYLTSEDTEGWRINIADITGRVRLVVLFPKAFVGHNWRMQAGSCEQGRRENTARKTNAQWVDTTAQSEARSCNKAPQRSPSG